MKEENQIAGDIKIAKFMGWRIDNSFPDKGRIWKSPEGIIELDTTFKFSKSIDQLLPVIERIEQLGCIIEISWALVVTCRICVINGKNESAFNIIHDNNGGKATIAPIWSAIVEFIDWYENKTTKLTEPYLKINNRYCYTDNHLIQTARGMIRADELIDGDIVTGISSEFEVFKILKCGVRSQIDSKLI